MVHAVLEPYAKLSSKVPVLAAVATVAWSHALYYTAQHSTAHKDLNRIYLAPITESDYDIYSKQINFAEDSLFSYIRSQKVKKKKKIATSKLLCHDLKCF